MSRDKSVYRAARHVHRAVQYLKESGNAQEARDLTTFSQKHFECTHAYRDFNDLMAMPGFIRIKIEFKNDGNDLRQKLKATENGRKFVELYGLKNATYLKWNQKDQMLEYKTSSTGDKMFIPNKNMHPLIHGDLLNIQVDKKMINYEICIIFPTSSKVEKEMKKFTREVDIW